MMRRSGKVVNKFNILAAFLTSFCVFFSIESNASTVNFDDPATITNGYSIFDYQVFKKTQLRIDFSGTSAVALSMNESSRADEFFFFKMINSSGTDINRVILEFIKPEGSFFSNIFHPLAFNLYDKNEQLKIDRGNVLISEINNIVSLDIPFVANREWQADDTAYFVLDWNGFHNYLENWQLTIDLFGEDDEKPVVTTPIPGAIWLFGSALLGIIAIPRRKKQFSRL